MKKTLSLFFLVVFLFLFFNNLVFSQERYASCDLCGYCPEANPNPPSNWQKCVQCLYPGASTDPTTKQTLIIDPATNLPPTPYPGRHYTMIGCVQTSSGGFESQKGVISIGQLFLNIIFSVVGGIAFLTFIYGIFVVMTSQNNPEKLDYGKRLIYGAIIGLVFSLSSVLIVRLIASNILKIPGFGGF